MDMTEFQNQIKNQIVVQVTNAYKHSSLADVLDSVQTLCIEIVDGIQNEELSFHKNLMKGMYETNIHELTFAIPHYCCLFKGQKYYIDKVELKCHGVWSNCDINLVYLEYHLRKDDIGVYKSVAYNCKNYTDSFFIEGYYKKKLLKMVYPSLKNALLDGCFSEELKEFATKIAKYAAIRNCGNEEEIYNSFVAKLLHPYGNESIIDEIDDGT